MNELIKEIKVNFTLGIRTDKFNTHLFYILNIIALTIYATALYNLEVHVDYDTMFSTIDSKSYLETASWID